MVDIKRLIKALRLNRLSCGIKKPCSDCELMEDCLYYQQNGAKEAADIIEHLEAGNAALRGQLDKVKKQAWLWKKRFKSEERANEISTEELLNVTAERDALTSRYGGIIHVVREHDECDVMLLLHKDSPEWSFVNLTKKHICPCRFTSREEAIKDLRQKCIRYEQ